jgi:hypothetical protein
MSEVLFKGPCEGYWQQKRCRRRVAFKHITEHGKLGGFSFVSRVRLCKRCSLEMDHMMHNLGAVDTRAGLMREPKGSDD